MNIQSIERDSDGYSIYAYIDDAIQTRWNPHAAQEWQGAYCYCRISDLLLDGETLPDGPELAEWLEDADWQPVDW